MRFLITLLVNAAALFVAARLVSGIRYDGPAMGLLGVALVFAVVNTLIKPIVAVLSIPALFLTLGLFTLVINALMLMLTAKLSGVLGSSFQVDGFWAGLWGAVVISIVSLVLGKLVSGTP